MNNVIELHPGYRMTDLAFAEAMPGVLCEVAVSLGAQAVLDLFAGYKAPEVAHQLAA